jgi:hypothetical protein
MRFRSDSFFKVAVANWALLSIYLRFVQFEPKVTYFSSIFDFSGSFQKE